VRHLVQSYEHFKIKMFLVQASYRCRTGVVQAPGKKAAPVRLFSPWRLKVSTAPVITIFGESYLVNNPTLSLEPGRYPHFAICNNAEFADLKVDLAFPSGEMGLAQIHTKVDSKK